jgi:hypothetical protein
MNSLSAMRLLAATPDSNTSNIRRELSHALFSSYWIENKGTVSKIPKVAPLPESSGKFEMFKEFPKMAACRKLAACPYTVFTFLQVTKNNLQLPCKGSEQSEKVWDGLYSMLACTVCYDGAPGHQGKTFEQWA